MASPSDNRGWELQPKDAKLALAEDKWDDCMSCRVTGSAAFIGAGIYSYHSGMTNLRKQEKSIMQSTSQYKMGSRRLGVSAIAGTLIAMGVYRAFN
ncbi:hypothetical protein N7448_004746 [Penicillium atrosanguineum]|uniref:Distal membrane-arm assembly complex protein 1-like domain-containing protein n=1 Tax=Penicillium atrosanguineum TaxID=1132637 RepID=A0A9W9U2P7_9EURO|nr:killer toxin subunits alpha/beta [Penicillium atrosanguineum]KAJ5125425.1 hypothetical protein N7526_007602 [Penicillium atrosanguineum]KAJ5136192.1 hypothetical protein N7448_004746 [Penicillium atrosanguineum]KAJ5292542.1 killer toxin subunits alpha/beta [Penicillium atrosanguineum]KAJ5303435.1 hypothetical protein N7476_010234 [Penicillium atrosanguineum]